ncbi:MAG: polysaccharide deacetylase family protein [Dethiobacter sp.]|nr:MAG: polysaccharide deacetylase family protein [Dethiobacter sp.]
MQHEKASFFLGFCFLITIFTANVITTIRPSSYPEPIYQVEGFKSVVFLTFDVLWQKEHLDDILEFLEERRIKAIFFVTGEWLKKNNHEAQKIIDYGHQLGNQTFSHVRLLLMKEEEIEQEIAKFIKLSQELLHYKPTFFRPPYGEYNSRIVRIAGEKDLFTLLWSINVKSLSERETELIISHLEESLHDGAILLCHTSSPKILQTLPEVIDFMEWKGYNVGDPQLIQEYAAKKLPVYGR